MTLSFVTPDDRVTWNDSNFPEASTVSYMCWIKITDWTASTNYRMIASKWPGTGSSGWKLEIGGGGNSSSQYLRAGCTTFTVTSGGPILSLGVWHHIAVSIDAVGDAMHIFHNGAPIGTTFSMTGNAGVNSASFRMGEGDLNASDGAIHYQTMASHMNGTFLTPEQVAACAYRRTVPGELGSAHTAWQMDEGTGTLISEGKVQYNSNTFVGGLTWVNNDSPPVLQIFPC